MRGDDDVRVSERGVGAAQHCGDVAHAHARLDDCGRAERDGRGADTRGQRVEHARGFRAVDYDERRGRLRAERRLALA